MFMPTIYQKVNYGTSNTRNSVGERINPAVDRNDQPSVRRPRKRGSRPAVIVYQKLQKRYDLILQRNLDHAAAITQPLGTLAGNSMKQSNARKHNLIDNTKCKEIVELAGKKSKRCARASAVHAQRKLISVTACQARCHRNRKTTCGYELQKLNLVLLTGFDFAGI
ncbi:hypothetical protein [Massilia sp. METH4]|uniref:hypothetical protein n=1 Tax=Massilia sp. METH4 TaxID=3123041 RepID=UPI0030CD9733